MEIDRGILPIWDHHGRLLAKVSRGLNHLYVLHLEVAASPLVVTMKLGVGMSDLGTSTLRPCGSWDARRWRVVTKQRRHPFPRQALYRAQEQLELVLGDLCGPVTLATPGGRCYSLLLVDDVSCFRWAVLLPTKRLAADAIKQVHAAAEKEDEGI